MRKGLVMSLLAALALLIFFLSAREPRSSRQDAAEQRAGGGAQAQFNDELARLLRARMRQTPRFLPQASRPSFPGTAADAVGGPEVLHWLEPRDPVWAPQMESALLGTYFRTDVFDRLGLWQMRVTELSCRQTTCRLSYEYPARLRDLVRASGLPPSSPMVLVEEELGWAAPRGGGLQRTSFIKDGEAFEGASLVLGYDERSWDPAGYADWLRGEAPATREFYRQARTSRQEAGAAGSPLDEEPSEPGDAG